MTTTTSANACTCTTHVECDACCTARYATWDAAADLARARLALEASIPRTHVRLMAGGVTPRQNRIEALHGVAAPARRAYVRALAAHARAMKAYGCKSCDVSDG